LVRNALDLLAFRIDGKAAAATTVACKLESRQPTPDVPRLPSATHCRFILFRDQGGPDGPHAPPHGGRASGPPLGAYR